MSTIDTDVDTHVHDLKGHGFTPTSTTKYDVDREPGTGGDAAFLLKHGSSSPVRDGDTHVHDLKGHAFTPTSTTKYDADGEPGTGGDGAFLLQHGSSSPVAYLRRQITNSGGMRKFLNNLLSSATKVCLFAIGQLHCIEGKWR